MLFQQLNTVAEDWDSISALPTAAWELFPFMLAASLSHDDSHTQAAWTSSRTEGGKRFPLLPILFIRKAKIFSGTPGRLLFASYWSEVIHMTPSSCKQGWEIDNHLALVSVPGLLFLSWPSSFPPRFFFFFLHLTQCFFYRFRKSLLQLAKEILHNIFPTHRAQRKSLDW